MSSKTLIFNLVLCALVVVVINAQSQAWRCNFSKNACHFRNQHNLAKFKRYHNPARKFFSQNSMLVLDLASPDVRRYPGARLITYYFPSNIQTACLHITYMLYGAGPRSFYVIQQDKQNNCIFVDDNTQMDTSGNWRNIELEINLQDGDPRFFMEIHFNNNKTGHAAISEFVFENQHCRNNRVNNCYAPIGHPNQYPVPGTSP